MHNLARLVVENINGMTFVAINTSTEPRLTGGKKNPYLGRVRKVMEGANVMIFQNKTGSGYDKMVKRRLEKEGKNPESFQLSPRKWGTRIPNTPFIEHKGQYYLEVIFLRSGMVTYTIDGMPVEDPSTITGLTLDKPEAEQGGLNDKVIIRTFKIQSITQIKINKHVYRDLYFDINEL